MAWDGQDRFGRGIVKGIKMNFQSTVIVRIAAFLLFLSASIPAQPLRPAAYGFAPAIPLQHVSDTIRPRLPVIGGIQDISLDLEISASGVLDTMTCDSSGERFFDLAAQYLASMTFAPAELDGLARPSRLPVVMQIEPRMRAPEFRFPVTSDGAINYELMMRSLTLNSVRPPTIDSFPSYYYAVADGADSIVPPSILFRLDLDATGEVGPIILVRASGTGFDDQLRSAIRWARFSPLSVGGCPRSTTAWLAATLYPGATYPSFVYPSDADAPWERFRLQLLPDTIGLMQRPVPKLPHFDRYSRQGDHQYFRDTVSALVVIDSLGHARLKRGSPAKPEVLSVISLAVAKTPFFPALGFDGRPRSFTGRALFILNGSTTIRIDYSWLR
ncbi:MAG: hypothetical protein ABIE70_01405 [bacterium]